MPSATASGADATPNGGATNRDHKQGNQDRKYTIEQKAAVIRVRKCGPTAFYEILGVEKTVTDGEVKKAYRKLSLLTHPDKNGYEGADEAFKSESPPHRLKHTRLGIYGIVVRITLIRIGSGIKSLPSSIGCGQEAKVR